MPVARKVQRHISSGKPTALAQTSSHLAMHCKDMLCKRPCSPRSASRNDSEMRCAQTTRLYRFL